MPPTQMSKRLPSTFGNQAYMIQSIMSKCCFLPSLTSHMNGIRPDNAHPSITYTLCLDCYCPFQPLTTTSSAPMLRVPDAAHGFRLLVSALTRTIAAAPPAPGLTEDKEQ